MSPVAPQADSEQHKIKHIELRKTGYSHCGIF